MMGTASCRHQPVRPELSPTHTDCMCCFEIRCVINISELCFFVLCFLPLSCDLPILNSSFKPMRISATGGHDVELNGSDTKWAIVILSLIHLTSPEQLGMKHLTRISPSTSAFIRIPCSTNHFPAAFRPAASRKFWTFWGLESWRLLTLAPMTTDNLSITSTNISLLPPWKHTHTQTVNSWTSSSVFFPNDTTLSKYLTLFEVVIHVK